MITVKNITKRFANYPALHDVNLTVEPGEFIALLGPSGSGKTTLLRIIAGLELQDSGQVLFHDEDVSHRPVAERGVGFVFQQYALFKHMTIAQNIAFGLKVRKRRDRPSAAAIRARSEELLSLVHLEGLGKRYPTQLSGGQRQRVALARALAVEPKLLLLDEPFGALDAQVRKDLRRWLRQLHVQMGLTSIFVTHDQEEALELADRIVVMNRGRIDQVGVPEEVYMQPASRFVSDFVGETNRLPVTVTAGTARYRDLILGQYDNASDGSATLDFRPHDVRVVEAGGEGLALTVRSVFRKGGFWRVEAVLPDETLVEIDLPDSETAPAADSLITIELLRGRLFAPE
ncbi:MAG TPA: sulfate/molybdate ABC transporter ATP-binding protein [Sphingobium sp.]|uniref:sulfate/molybdate ABC transporter ATP-binding protein n=1 Tax=Sphingobium sp. TaxID=1912891 RepID=UPI002ED516A0